MWLYTTFGFYSVVAHRDLEDTLLVRARVQGDLEKLREVMPELGVIQETPDADYAYRAIITRPDLARGMTELVKYLDYPNFKNAVMERQGLARERAYEDVWRVTRRDLEALNTPRLPPAHEQANTILP